MPREDEILAFLDAKMFKPILDSEDFSERFKTATRGLRLRMRQRNAPGMINYFWNYVYEPNNKHANYARMLRNEKFPEFEQIANEFRVKFSE